MTTRKMLLAGLIALAPATPSFAAQLVLNNVDSPGVGFNDPTPATPVGGNTGTTVGEQRLVAYRRALDLWGKTLRSNVPIVVQGSFAGLPCDATGGVLAQAGALQIFADFPGAPLPGHWYHAALANAISGFDLTPGPPDPGPIAPPYNDDIIANFNGDVGTPGCIEGPGWYYGLDNNAPDGQIDFLDTFMHEVAHGLGFQNFADLETGETIENLPDVYMANTLDLTQGLLWNQMFAGQIAASAVNNRQVVWAGPSATTNANLVLGPYQGLQLSGALTSELFYGAASFGAPVGSGFGGPIALGTDATAPVGDACEPITTSLAGQVALVDRGTCTFNVKAKNAQDAGATAVIIANTLGRPDFSPGGADATVTVPVVGISNADGDAIKAALPSVGVSFFTDPTRRAGTSDGQVRLYAPAALSLGSSISHWDTAAVPDLLMEPFINDGLRSARNLDLTPALMQDIGWDLESLKIERCDTHVPNALANGDLLHVQVQTCTDQARNKLQYLACVTGVALRADVPARQTVAIIGCAAKSVIHQR